MQVTENNRPTMPRDDMLPGNPSPLTLGAYKVGSSVAYDSSRAISLQFMAL